MKAHSHHQPLPEMSGPSAIVAIASSRNDAAVSASRWRAGERDGIRMHRSPLGRSGSAPIARCRAAAGRSAAARCAAVAMPAQAPPISAGRRTRTTRQSASSSSVDDCASRRPRSTNATAGSNAGRSATRVARVVLVGLDEHREPGHARLAGPRPAPRTPVGARRRRARRPRSATSRRARSSSSARSPPGMRYPPSTPPTAMPPRSGSATLRAAHPEPALEQVHADRGGDLDAELEAEVRRRRRARGAARDARDRPDERGVEQDARLGVAALLLFAHHQLAAPGGRRPVHAAQRVAVPVLAGDELVGVRMRAPLQPVQDAVDARRRAERRVERRDPRRHDDLVRGADVAVDAGEAERVGDADARAARSRRRRAAASGAGTRGARCRRPTAASPSYGPIAGRIASGGP